MKIILLILLLFVSSLIYSQPTIIDVATGKYAVSNFTNGTKIRAKATSDFQIGYNDSLSSVNVVDTVLYIGETRPVSKTAYLAIQRDSTYDYFEINDDTTVIGAYGTGVYPVINVLIVDTVLYPNFELVGVTVNSYNYSSTNNSANTYYVSNLGNDSWSGTEPDSAWATIDKVNSISFIPGDSILLAATDTFIGPLVFTESGKSDSLIIVSKYGTGAKPIIYGDHPNATWAAVDGYTGIYSTPNGGAGIQKIFDADNNEFNKRKQEEDSFDTWLGKFEPGDWGFTWDTGLTYVRTIDGNSPSQMRMLDWAAVHTSSNANYITFDNLDLRNGNMGFVVTGSDYIIVQNNNIQDMYGTGVFYGKSLSNFSFNGEIANNTVTRTGWTSIYFYKGGYHWVHHNTISHAIDTILGIAVNGKELCGVGLQEGQNNIIEYNNLSYLGSGFDYYFEANSIVRYNEASHVGGCAYPHGTGLKLYYNVFDLNGIGKGFGGGHYYDSEKSPVPPSGPNEIYNNTIYNSTSYGIISGSDSMIYKNNLVIANASSAIVNISGGIEIDYNVYYNTDGDTRNWYWNGSKYSTFSDFQAVSGQDANSIEAAPLFTDAANGDFTLQTGSPAIDAGTDVGLTEDILGNPIVGAPDIGSYEYQY